MSILGRVFVILIFVLSVGYVAVQSALWHHSRDWREAYTLVTRDYEELANYQQRQTEALRQVADDRLSIIKDRNNVITKLQTSIRTLSDDLAVAVTNYSTVKQDMVTLLNDHTRVLMILSKKDDLIDSLTQARDDYRNKFESALRQKDTAEMNVYRLTMSKGALEKDLHDLNQNYADLRQELNEKELLLARLRQSGVNIEILAGGVPAPPINSQVVAVKPDVKLVLLSVGRENGVEEGFEFTVYRGSKFVAKVVVERVLPTLCGCRILYQKSEVREGDQAATYVN